MKFFTNENNELAIKLNVPAGLNIEELLKNEGEKPRFIKCNAPKYYYLIDHIFTSLIINREYKKSGWVKINKKTIEESVNRAYWEPMKKRFIKWGWIEVDNYYTYKTDFNPHIDSESKGYRFTTAFSETFNDWQVRTFTGINFISRLKEVKTRKVSKFDTITKAINFWLSDIDIDEAAATKWVKTQKFTQEKEKSYQMFIEAVKAGNGVYSRDKAGRVHHILTNLPKGLRKFLYIKHAPETQLVNLDVANSQPFALNKIILEHYAGQELPEDVKKYIDITSVKGTFNKYLIDAFGIPPEKHDEFKEDVFGKIFYCKNSYSLKTELAAKFNSIFPNVFEVIVREKADNHKNLSFNLQKIESDAILNGAIATLNQIHKDKVVFSTIHDSILCPVDYAQEVREVMKTEYKKIVGFEPVIRQENLNTPQVKPIEAITTPLTVSKPETPITTEVTPQVKRIASTYALSIVDFSDDNYESEIIKVYNLKVEELIRNKISEAA